MRKNILVVLLVIVGMIFILYPFISNIINNSSQTKLITDYKSSVEMLTDEEKEEKIKNAEKYNQELETNIHVDLSFDENQKQEESTSYLNILDVGEVLGYISIPKIDIELPIYHGTTDDVLKSGVGHVDSSSLPVGGKSTHAVLAGHTGLATGKIFDNINELKIGDIFYLNVLDKKLEYKVDNIVIVEPNNEDIIHVEENKDYVTLITCTPKFINSHRLLVRGERVPEEAKSTQLTNSQESMYRDEINKSLEETSTVKNNNSNNKEEITIYIVIGVILALICTLVVFNIFTKDEEKAIISNKKFEALIDAESGKKYRIIINADDFLELKNIAKNRYEFYILENERKMPIEFIFLDEYDLKKSQYKYKGWKISREKWGCINFYEDGDIKMKITSNYFKGLNEKEFAVILKKVLKCVKIEKIVKST